MKAIYRENLKFTDLKKGDYICVSITKNDYTTYYEALIEADVEGKHVLVTLIEDLTNKRLKVNLSDSIKVSMKNCSMKTKLGRSCHFDALGRLQKPYVHHDEQRKHPSFGQLQIHRYSGGSGQQLYGSSIEHNGGISLKICPSEYKRSLNNDYYHAEPRPLIEINMSYNQFAEAITSGMNSSGTPVTIVSFNGERVEGCTFENKRKQIDKEFENYIKKIGNNIAETVRDAEELLSGSKAPNKSERELILNRISSLKQALNSNIPFIKKQFSEEVDKTIVEAKSEIEGFYEGKIRSLGVDAVKALNIQPVTMIEGEIEDVD